MQSSPLPGEALAACGPHHGALLDRAGRYDIIDCAHCGFAHAVPLPEPAALREEYRSRYYDREKPLYLEAAAADQDWSILAETDRLDGLGRACGGPGRLIEFGSGPGFFLKTAAALGWRATGIEPSKQAASFAREQGLDVIEGFVEDVSPALGEADAVAATNMLEHVPDPAHVLSLARDCLRDGGAIAVTVPNDYSPMQEAARGGRGLKPWWVAPPHHLNYFGFDSLEALLRRLGFVPVERQTSFPMEAFLLMGEDYTSDPDLGRTAHAKRKAFDLAFERAGLSRGRRGFYAALAAAGMGREATVIAVKA